MDNYNISLPEIDAYVAMREHIGYFGQQCTLLNPNGPQQFIENELQNDIFLSYKNFNNIAIEAPRQCGVTTSISLMALHTAIFNAHQTIVLMSHKHEQAREILARVCQLYDSLPESRFIKPQMTRRNKDQIEFENRCRIFAVPASTERLKGLGINHVFLDNAAFIDHKKFFETVGPSLHHYKTGRMIVATTGSAIHPDFIMNMARGGVKYIRQF
jgi:phage terminase large subunit-like protein